MPYITEKRRDEDLADSGNIDVRHSRRDLGIAMGEAMDNGGDLQYMIAEAVQRFLEIKGLRYARCEEIMGAIDGASKEFYRVVVAPYEDKKMRAHGPVYDLNVLSSDQY